MEERQFHKLSLQKKNDVLRKKGHFIASRYYQTYRIHLYKLDDFLAEVWVKLGLNQIYWIETVDEDRLELYADSLNLNIDL